jgi:hypothetical protein
MAAVGVTAAGVDQKEVEEARTFNAQLEGRVYADILSTRYPICGIVWQPISGDARRFSRTVQSG